MSSLEYVSTYTDSLLVENVLLKLGLLHKVLHDVCDLS